MLRSRKQQLKSARLLVTVGALACADPSAPYATAPMCNGAVTVTFSRTERTIAWSPGCGVSEVVLSDVDAARAVWGFRVSEARPLRPSLRYGQTPTGAELWAGPFALEAGHRYQIIVAATVGGDVSVGGGQLELIY